MQRSGKLFLIFILIDLNAIPSHIGLFSRTASFPTFSTSCMAAPSNPNNRPGQYNPQPPNRGSDQQPSGEGESRQSRKEMYQLLEINPIQMSNVRAPPPEFLIALYNQVANQNNGVTRAAAPFDADKIIGLTETGTFLVIFSY